MSVNKRPSKFIFPLHARFPLFLRTVESLRLKVSFSLPEQRHARFLLKMKQETAPTCYSKAINHETFSLQAFSRLFGSVLCYSCPFSSLRHSLFFKSPVIIFLTQAQSDLKPSLMVTLLNMDINVLTNHFV